MSLINQLNATTEYYWLKTKMGDCVDIVSKASPLLWKLMGNAVARDNWQVKPHEVVDGGLMVKIPLEYAQSNRGGYGADTVINQSKVDILDAARFGWAGVYGSNTLNLDDVSQNSGDEAVIDLSKKYIQSIIKAARIQMAEDIVTAAADSTRINGLGDLFNTNAATEYGSISANDIANWAPSVITTPEPISFEVMQSVWRAPNMGELDEFLPNFVVTTPLLRDGYERSLHPQQRYANTKMVEAGWDNITHKGAPIVGGAYISTGDLYALNLNFLHLRSHKDFNFTTPVWLNKGILGQPDLISANTRWRGNLYCSNRKMQVYHSSLTPPA
jgi:hypothetical protein